MIKMSNEMNELLKKCLMKRDSHLLYLLENDKFYEIDDVLGNELRDIVADELINVGFNDDVPNELGLKLEKLIDEIGRLFLYD